MTFSLPYLLLSLKAFPSNPCSHYEAMISILKVSICILLFPYTEQIYHHIRNHFTSPAKRIERTVKDIAGGDFTVPAEIEDIARLLKKIDRKGCWDPPPPPHLIELNSIHRNGPKQITTSNNSKSNHYYDIFSL